MNTSQQPTNLSTQNRVIRVFISSTFRDMMRERDLLVKEVFPELRRKCAKLRDSRRWFYPLKACITTQSKS
jgi:hypothetical protein